MNRGPTTGKELFDTRLRMLIGSECRRRKTGRQVVHRHVVRVLNSLRYGDGWRWTLAEEKPNATRQVSTRSGDKQCPVADYIRRNKSALEQEHPDGIW